MIAFINASPLIFLSKLNQLSLLPKLFSEVITTKQVKQEVLINHEQINYSSLESFIQNNILIRPLKDQNLLNNLLSSSSLHVGEAGLIIIAKDFDSDKKICILDDKAARNLAKTFDLRVLGTIGVLLLGLKRGLLKKEESKMLIDKLVVTFDFRISTATYIEVIKQLDSF